MRRAMLLEVYSGAIFFDGSALLQSAVGLAAFMEVIGDPRSHGPISATAMTCELAHVIAIAAAAHGESDADLVDTVLVEPGNDHLAVLFSSMPMMAIATIKVSR